MDLNAAIRIAIGPYLEEVKRLREIVNSAPISPTYEIDRLPGRRVFFHYVQTQDFTTTQDGTRGSDMTFRVSQDGPFVMTHYPVAMWRSTVPTNATDFGLWRPVSTWPSPTQDLGAYRNVINLSYELSDSGSTRKFQDGAMPPLFSRPDDLKPLPCPTLFKENSTILFTPVYEDISFGGGTATTTGRLVVAIPGYRIITAVSGNY